MQKRNHQPTLQPSLSAENRHVNFVQKLVDAETKSPAYPPASTLGGNRQVNYAQKVLDAETELPAYPAAFTLGTNRHVNSEPVLDSGRKLRTFYFSFQIFPKSNDFSYWTGPRLRS